MKVTYSAVNAFTTAPDGGNPAAVVFLPPPSNPSLDISGFRDGDDIIPLYPPNSTLQAIASKIDFPMTAFLISLPSSGVQQDQNASAGKNQTDRYALRWFNPDHEVWICGHATMALSHHLAHANCSATGAKPAEKNKLHLLTVKYGTVSSVQVIDPWGSGYLTAIDFPQLTTFEELEIDTGRGKEAWDIIKAASDGIEKEDVLAIREDEQRVLLELRKEVDLKSAKIDCTKFDALAPKYVIPFQIASTLPGAANTQGGPHVHSRCFGSGGFALEDSATGSAHCAIIPYFLSDPAASARLLETHPAESFGLDPKMRRILRVKQLSERGGDMAVCWNEEAGTVRIMGTCCSSGEKEVEVDI